MNGSQTWEGKASDLIDFLSSLARIFGRKKLHKDKIY